MEKFVKVYLKVILICETLVCMDSTSENWSLHVGSIFLTRLSNLPQEPPSFWALHKVISHQPGVVDGLKQKFCDKNIGMAKVFTRKEADLNLEIENL